MSVESARSSLSLSATIVIALVCVALTVSGVFAGASFFPQTSTRTTTDTSTTTSTATELQTSVSTLTSTETVTMSTAVTNLIVSTVTITLRQTSTSTTFTPTSYTPHVAYTIENAYVLSNGSIYIQFRNGYWPVNAIPSGIGCASDFDGEWGPVQPNQTVLLKANMGVTIAPGTVCNSYISPNADYAAAQTFLYPTVVASVPAPAGLNVTSASLQSINETGYTIYYHVHVELKNSGSNPLTSVFITQFNAAEVEPLYFTYNGTLVSSTNPVPPGGSAVMDRPCDGNFFVFAASFQDGAAASTLVYFT